ncbi:MAG: tetratricopeptide repeat protein [Sphingobacteriales bacterium]|nr:tetratricopeptide repeat protein [Sphingobacteriales bacterium]
MAYYEDYSEDLGQEHTDELVELFETMQRSNKSFYFDQSSYEQIIEHYEEQVLYDKALKAAEQALLQHPYSAFFLSKKALFLLETQTDVADEALQLLAQAKMYDRTESEIYLLEGEVYLEQGNMEDALESIAAGRQYADEENIIDFYMLEADVYEVQGNFQKVFELLSQVLHIDPEYEEALERISFIIEEAEMYEQGIALHEQLCGVYPFSKWAWLNLGKAYAGIEQYEKSLDAFGYALAIDKSFEPALRESGDAHYELEQYEQALDCFLQAQQQAPRDADLLCAIGWCHFEIKNLSKSVFYFKKALISNESHADAKYGMAMVHKEKEEWQTALMYCKQAAKSEPDIADYGAACAEIYLRLGDVKQSIAYYVKTMERHPTNTELWLQLALLLFNLEDYEDTWFMIEKAMSLFPEQAEFLYLAFAVKYQTHEIPESYAFLEQALERNYSLHPYMFHLMPSLQENQRITQMIEAHRL